MPDNEHLMSTWAPDWNASPKPVHIVCVVCGRRADESGLCRDHKYDDQPTCGCGVPWIDPDATADPARCERCGDVVTPPGQTASADHLTTTEGATEVEG